MKVLIVDDSFYKIDILSNYINRHSPGSFIDTAESISNAIQIIKEKPLIYNLIIIDQYLPTRNGENPIPNGGQLLLMEINRTLKSKIPNYIIGFSQYDNKDVEFSKIWKVIKFSADSTDWQLSLSELLNHIKNNNFNNESEIIKPTIFVEGLTDKFYFDQTISNYFPEFIDKISIRSQPNAGSSWVINQIVAWSHSMQKDDNDNYIKCVGILDNDVAGRKSKRDLDLKGFSANQKSTFKCISLAAKHNANILDYYKKGCKIEIDIESMFDINIWNLAEEKGILEMRNPVFSDDPIDWQPYTETSKDFMLKQGIIESNLIYTKKVKSLKKDDFLKIVKKGDVKDNLKNMAVLLKEVINELGII